MLYLIDLLFQYQNITGKLDNKITNALVTGSIIAAVNLFLSYMYFSYYIYVGYFSYFGLLFALAGTLSFILYKNSQIEVKSDNKVTVVFIVNMFIDVSMFIMYVFFSFKLV